MQKSFSFTNYLFVLMFLFFSFNTFSQGGMWIPSILEGINEKEMHEMGMELSAEDIYDINNSSIKDAIVRFGRGCTGEIISDQGLLLTNHHCGYGNIQSHSTLENNLLENGFWAGSKEEELPNPGLSVLFIERIEDVTALVLEGVTTDLEPTEKQSRIDKNLAQIRSNTIKESFQDVMIRPFYYGNKYYLFVTSSFEDVRLVGAPPESIGKFGADTDNWVFPRHNADFSLFRVYADSTNRPAPYSVDNVPYKPKHHLPISIDGVEEGDFTMIFGFPGRTREYLPSVAIEQIVEVRNPAKILIRETSLGVMDRYMRADAATRLQYASKFAGIANYWKKWIGESQGLKAVKAINQKQEFEEEFTIRLQKDPELNSKYGHLLENFDSLYLLFEPYALADDIVYESYMRNIELMRILGNFDRLIGLYKNNGVEAYKSYKNRLLPYLGGTFKSYNKAIDKDVFKELTALYKETMEPQFIPGIFTKFESVNALTEEVYENTLFTNFEKVESLLLKDSIDQVINSIQQDPAFRMAMELKEINDQQITPEYNRIQAEINSLQKDYMMALMEAFPEERFFPDANSTLRITYGQVKGYEPRDAVYYQASTHLSGVIEKYKPGDYEFDVPEKLLQLHASGDFGVYADETGEVPVCFIGTNHTTGGNSGSPALDAKGNLIGLNFDRVWEGTMSDLFYDPSICRNIMVDARYILFIIDKFAGADHLIKEMEIVRPKSRQ